MRPMDDGGERALVARARKGDMEAFETLVKLYQRGIYALCCRMTGAHQAADDLTQETFIKAFSGLASFDQGREFFPWLRRIAVNSSLNYLKSRKREEPLGEKDGRVPGQALPSSSSTPQDELQRNEAREKLDRALKALPPKLKSVFVLHVFDGLSYEEISRAVEIPRGTVMSRLSRARRRLKAALSGAPAGR
ncbi:MAG TPA: sigma-70 family RNA polymerase sigma factor [Acidobacteriota bacterium]